MTNIIRRAPKKPAATVKDDLEERNESRPVAAFLPAPTSRDSNTPAANRWSVRIDYAPDVCKDYLETGYCGFGDSCKFLHDRGDYKLGWQIDAEQPSAEIDYSILLASSSIESGCGICGQGDDLSVIRLLPECGHRFCKACILGRLKAKLRCPTCGVPVKGSLHTPLPLT